ncbi:hypothetical protein R1sor_004712 [Riccia sorocarpa]|uniref:Uncharacterized protein n=1 Tax=Riccia sorocarpa TaxID=122646 RepID=A0ABD3HLS0_9MARC
MKDPDLVIRGTNSSRVTSPDLSEPPVLGAAIVKAQKIRDSKKLSWVRYEEVIKNRPSEDYGRSLSISPNGPSRRSSRVASPENSQTPSRGPSPVGHVPPEQNRRSSPIEIRADFFQDPADSNSRSKSHVRFSASLPNLPIDSSPIQNGVSETPELEAGVPPATSPSTSPELQIGPLSPSSLEFQPPPVVGLLWEQDRNLIFGFSPQEAEEPKIQITYTPRVPGDHAWREEQDLDPPPVVERLEQQSLLLSVPSYLGSLRGHSRDGERASPGPGFQRPSNIAGVPVAASHRRSTFVRAVEAVTSLGTPALAPSTERRTSKYVTTAPKKNSTVIVPVNAKQWLLQSLRMQDWELRELFDQMEMIPQLAADHVREVRAEWESLEARSLKVPPEADMLLKDQQLLERTKSLLRRFISVVSDDERAADELQSRSPAQGASPDLDQETMTPDATSTSAPTPQPNIDVQAQQDNTTDEAHPEQSRKERDVSPSRQTRGSTSPIQRSGSVLGRPVCPACGRLDTSAPNTIIRGGVLPRESIYQERAPSIPHQNLPSFIPFEDYVIRQSVVKPTRKSDQFKTTYSPLDKRWYTVLFPALQPGKREDVTLLSEWLMHACQKNAVEDPDGHFSNVEMAFVLHCVAFLEIVRQVRIHCEDRGDMILHVWRQLLRIFNQVHFLPG